MMDSFLQIVLHARSLAYKTVEVELVGLKDAGPTAITIWPPKWRQL